MDRPAFVLLGLVFAVLDGCASNGSADAEDDTPPTDSDTDTDTDADTDTDTDADTDIVAGCDRSVLGGLVPAPVAFWTFDASSRGADMVVDLQGTANGTLVGGPALTLGACAEGLSLDGVDDFVRIDNEAAFDFDADDAFTIAAWVNVVPGAFGPVVFGKSDNDVAAGGSPGYYLGVRTPADNDGANLDLVNDPETSAGGSRRSTA